MRQQDRSVAGQLRRGLLTSIVVGGMTLLAGTAHASSITYSNSLPDAGTDWSNFMSLTKFDPSLGTLTGIDLTLTGDVAGSAGYESRNAVATEISLLLKARITLNRPDNTQLVVVLPLLNDIIEAPSYDGSDDFSGTSGAIGNGLAASTFETVPLLPADFGLFSGLGNILLPVSAVGNSVATASGNFDSFFLTSAGASASITYDYDRPIVPQGPSPDPPSEVPEPASLVLLGSGLVAIAARLRKRA